MPRVMFLEDSMISYGYDVWPAAEGGTGWAPPIPASRTPDKLCDVYWGSHGCGLPRGHQPSWQHRCDCANEPGAVRFVDGGSNVGAFPYYGAHTHFYGEDVEVRYYPVDPETDLGV